MVEDSAYFKMLERMIRAGGKRAGRADEIELKTFYLLKNKIEEETKKAVQSQMDQGKSWSDIGEALGISRQAAFKKFR